MWDGRGDEGREVGDKWHVVDSSFTSTSAENGGKSKTHTRERKEEEKNTHTEINDAILDKRGGCLNTSESLLDNRVQWYEKAASRESGYTRRRRARRTGRL